MMASTVGQKRQKLSVNRYCFYQEVGEEKDLGSAKVFH